MDPLDLLIEDCWRHLFKFLSAEDKQALCDTCGTFHAMLQPQKVEWGIELILPHVTKYIIRSSWGYIDRKQLLSFNLKCRQVCKSWRVTFDKVSGSIRSIHHSPIRDKYNLKDVSTLEKFLNFFKDHRGNPFIGRRVTIFAAPLILLTTKEILECLKEVEEPEVNEEGNAAAENDENEEVEHTTDAKVERFEQKMSLKNRELLLELLLSYGKEIEHLTVNTGRRYYKNSETQLDEFQFFQLILCNTPNLQSLELRLGLFCTKRKNSTIQTAISEYFEVNPLPKRPILRELTLHDNNPQIKTLLLEAYGGNLQILRMNSVAEIPLPVWSSMKCLKKLKLERLTDFASYENILQALQSPLEILSISENHHRRNSGHCFMIDKFLLAVQHLPLKKIEIIPVSYNVKESAPFPSDFPKHFTITEFTLLFVRSSSINFLQFLPNLQKQVVINNALSFLSNDVFRKKYEE